jgi:hypothetical protein
MGGMSSPSSPAPVQHEHHDSHGSTPAAWTTVVIITIAFILGTLAVIWGNWPLFWASVGLCGVAVIVGAIMAKAGLGKKRS